MLSPLSIIPLFHSNQTDPKKKKKALIPLNEKDYILENFHYRKSIHPQTFCVYE